MNENHDQTSTIEEENTPNLEEDTTTNSYDDQSSYDDQDAEGRGTRWKEGDEITFVRVRFPGNSKSFPFLQGKRQYSYGQKVVAMSDRGMDVGYINSFPYTVAFKKDMLPIRSISKVADQSDIEAMRGNLDEQKKAERKAVHIIERLNLDMQITHVEIIQFGKKMVFYFTAPARVDFRELVKQLVSELKMRIELRQINVRDRAAALGSIGSCGLATCCSTFLKNYGNVTIKMAKNQNLALIPSKINGVCGQIKCCIKYEDNVYSDKRKTLPKEGTFLKAKNGDIGKVTKLHILIEQFDMITEKGQIRRYARHQFSQQQIMGKDYKFPESFRHVVNETSQVVGLGEMEADMAQQFNQNMSDDEKAMANIHALKNDNHIIRHEDNDKNDKDENVDDINEQADQDEIALESDRDDSPSEEESNQTKKNQGPRRNNRRPNKGQNRKRRPNSNPNSKEPNESKGDSQNPSSEKKSRPNHKKRRRPNHRGKKPESSPKGDS
jgi:cell fate regulator YaaT (PSP1 superfamily)